MTTSRSRLPDSAFDHFQNPGKEGVEALEVHFTADVQASRPMARETGRPSDELPEDAVADLFDELAYTGNARPSL
jgi:hypothetical protein